MAECTITWTEGVKMKRERNRSTNRERERERYIYSNRMVEIGRQN